MKLSMLKLEINWVQWVIVGCLTCLWTVIFGFWWGMYMLFGQLFWEVIFQNVLPTLYKKWIDK